MRKVPSVVQLPGGRKLSAVPFRVVSFNEDGSPRTFQILPADEEVRSTDVYLFADERWIRSPSPDAPSPPSSAR